MQVVKCILQSYIPNALLECIASIATGKVNTMLNKGTPFMRENQAVFMAVHDLWRIHTGVPPRIETVFNAVLAPSSLSTIFEPDRILIECVFGYGFDHVKCFVKTANLSAD